MTEIRREFTNFQAGELTYHEAVEGGDYTAQEMINLRADTNGALRQRHGIIARGHAFPEGLHITGIAASKKILLLIRSDGLLFYRNNRRLNQITLPINITGRGTRSDGRRNHTGLNGRLSIIEDYGNEFYIITSEGTDQGLWIDLRDPDNIEAHQLGFNPPLFEASITPSEYSGQQGIAGGLPNYFYRFTYVRDTRTPADIANGVPIDEEPFNNVESNPTPAIYAASTATRGQNGYKIEGIKFPNSDGLERAIAVYRSRPIGTRELQSGRIDAEDEALDYRRVGIYPPPRDIVDVTPGGVPPGRTEPAIFDDFMSEEVRTEQELLRFDNNRMPSTVKSFTLYNDLIFAPNRDELRYSELRFEGLALWAFPEKNSIRRPVDAQFASAYRDMLLWGGRNGLWRLTGGTEYNFAVDRISNVGAIDGYAHATTEDVLGYITPAGMHFSDGVSTSLLSEPLKAHFENSKPVRGAVTFMPDGRTLFSIVFAQLDGSLTRKTWMRDRQWQQWTDIAIEQSTQFNVTEITGDTITQLLITENTQFIREVLWQNTEQTRDGKNETERELIKWSWRSQRLDWIAQGIATEIKRFTELLIMGKANSEIETETGTQPAKVTVIFTIYDAENDTTTVTKEVTLNRPHLYPVRIPIRKRGIAIDFEIQGQGYCDIRSLCIKGSV